MLCFSLVCGLCVVYHSRFVCTSFGVVGRLWSVIVSVPGHPYYYLTFHANRFHVKSCFLRKIKKKKKMFQYLFHLPKKLPSMRFYGLFNYNVYCADCMPSPGLIFWIDLFKCTCQGFRKEREGSGRGAGLPWGIDGL